MKLALLATALLIGSNVVAVSGEKNLNFKLVTIYMGEKDGENHLMGVTVSPDGSLGTKDFYDKAGENGASTGHSVYYFPNGTLVVNYKGAATGTATSGHFKGTYEILSGTGEYQGATGTGAIDGAYGDASPLKNAGLYDIQLNIRTPGT
jgi:hypothetical protein